MTEQNPDDRRDGPAAGGSWGDPHPDATQVFHPLAGGDEQPTTVSATPLYPPRAPDQPADPSPASTPSTGNPPVGAPFAGSEPSSAGQAGQWRPAYSPQPAYGSQPAMTSVYPPSTPDYAPSGYPAAYAPPVAVAPPASAVLVSGPSSRVGPGFLAALIGLLLSAGGVYLAVKFGVAAATDINERNIVVKDSALAAIGAILLLAAVLLNGWSPWSTIIPGIALTGAGGWSIFTTSGAAKVASWTNSVLSPAEFATWNIVGFSLILGLVMLGASIAAAMARASGKKDGLIVGFRQI